MNGQKIPGQVETASFQGRVNHKVALLFGINLLGVLLVGAMSILFARSIYTAAEEIRKEHVEIAVADRIHGTFQHFVLALYRAAILSRPVPESVRSAYREELKRLLAHEHGYHRGSPENEVVDELRRTSSGLFTLSAELGIERPNAGVRPNRQHLDELENFASTIQVSIHRLSLAHQARMDRLLEQNQSSMRWIFTFYVTFFLLGAVLVVGSSFYFGHTIARPLRWLSRAAEEVAQGRAQKKTPVVSNDEIGLLAQTFNVMVERLAEHEAKLRQLTILEERERIAAELHDSLAQSLAYLNLKLNELESGLGKERPRTTDGTVNEMRKIVGDAYDDVRQAIFGLRAEMSENGDFIPSLTQFVHDYSAMRKLPVDLRIPNPEAIRVTLHAEVQLIRIIQEALTNVSNHAKARKSVVNVECDGDYARIIIEDDGEGFLVDGAGNSNFRFGLKTMRERTQAVGGQFTVESALGKGTKIIVRLPLERNNRYEADSTPAR